MVLLDEVGAGVLLVDSSVGALVSVVGADAVEVNSVVVVGDGDADDEYVAAVVPRLGFLSCWQRASRTHGGHMCGERQRSAVFDIVS